jgi:hypothetical protein
MLPNKYNFLARYRGLLLLLLLIASTGVYAQQKIGLNPTVINPSSVLELESNKQGFLLPRITDTTLINALTPPAGTMIYFSDAALPQNSGIYIRRTVASVPGWYKLSYSADDRSWTVDGNTINPALFPQARLGSINGRSLSFITNNLVRMTVDSLSGKISVVDSLSVAGALHVHKVATLDSQLVVADTASFAKLVRAGTNLTVADTLLSKVAKFSDSLYLTNLKGLSLLTTVLVQDTVSGTVQRRNLPADVFKGWTIGNVDTSSFATALQRITGQNQDRDTLIIHGATLSAPGVVTTAKQYIAGTKVVRDSMLVGHLVNGAEVTTPVSTLQVAGSVSLNIQRVTTSLTLNETHHTVVTDGNLTVTLPSATTVTGRVYIIKAVNDITKVDTDKPVRISGIIDGTDTSSSPMLLYIPGASVKLQSGGAGGWYIIP